MPPRGSESPPRRILGALTVQDDPLPEPISPGWRRPATFGSGWSNSPRFVEHLIAQFVEHRIARLGTTSCHSRLADPLPAGQPETASGRYARLSKPPLDLEVFEVSCHRSPFASRSDSIRAATGRWPRSPILPIGSCCSREKSSNARTSKRLKLRRPTILFYRTGSCHDRLTLRRS